MFRHGTLCRGLRLVPAAGLVLVNGCLAALESGVDLVLAPHAFGNTLVAPYSPLSGLVQALARFAQG